MGTIARPLDGGALSLGRARADEELHGGAASIFSSTTVGDHAAHCAAERRKGKRRKMD